MNGSEASRRRLLRAAMAWAACSVAGAPPASAQGRPASAGARPSTPAGVESSAPRLLILGDSLSAEYGLRRGAGWVSLLEQRLRAQRSPWQVVNASISGETTSGGAARLPALLQRHAPRAVVIELGGNDALRGLPLASTRDNLRSMARAAAGAGARVLIAGMQIPPNYGRAYAEGFSRMFTEVARAERAVLVPFLLEGLVEREDLFQADRIHPTEAAQPILLENMWPALAGMLQVAQVTGS